MNNTTQSDPIRTRIDVTLTCRAGSQADYGLGQSEQWTGRYGADVDCLLIASIEPRGDSAGRVVLDVAAAQRAAIEELLNEDTAVASYSVR